MLNHGGDACRFEHPQENDYVVFAASAIIRFMNGKYELVLDGAGDIDG
jgi:hypothetical protein